MTTIVDIVNRALQTFGTRTTVTQSELDNSTSNEAIQANLIYSKLRQDLLRMAPWNCGLNYANLTLIMAAPGTPENPSAGTTLWQKGTPPPPWAYEYQYPSDCLRPCWVIPQFQTGFASGVPITTAVTGGAPAYWQGPPVKFKVGVDQFYSVPSATVVNGGTGYAIGDQITLENTDTADGDTGIAAPAILQVATVAAGVILTVTAVSQVLDAVPPKAGSYFNIPADPVAQDTTTGSGTGATFNLDFNTTRTDQRVILTNQEFATLAYVRNVTDIDVMDPLFQDAWVELLGARLAMALTGDKAMTNMLIAEANAKIMEARKADGNEGLTVNDVTPDFMRVRGMNYTEGYSGPYAAFDWGGLWPSFTM